MNITGKVSWKCYKCRECGHEQSHSTNHYGAIYVRCNSCSWKSPMSPTKVFDCQDPLPEGWGIPEEWKMVRLGDVLEQTSSVKSEPCPWCKGKGGEVDETCLERGFMDCPECSGTGRVSSDHQQDSHAE